MRAFVFLQDMHDTTKDSVLLNNFVGEIRRRVNCLRSNDLLGGNFLISHDPEPELATVLTAY